MSYSVVFLIITIASGIAWAIGRRESTSSQAASPWWSRYLGDYFFVFLGVFIFRSFLFESFMIPSASMVPTLVKSDYIAVTKFAYSIKLPIIDREVLRFGDPKHGDVIVFKNPLTPEVDFVKRVVGKPGDKISYIDKRLSVNGTALDVQDAGEYQNMDRDYLSKRFTENNGESKYSILNDPDAVSSIYNPSKFSGFENCTYLSNGVTCTVPQDRFFVMGDNRDNSQDSRFWGFVPRNYIAGRADYIWVNPQDTSRIGSIK